MIQDQEHAQRRLGELETLFALEPTLALAREMIDLRIQQGRLAAGGSVPWAAHHDDRF